MFTFTYWITAKCNLNCRYCYETEKENCSMTEEMIDNSLIFLKKVMSEKSETELSIGFHGGEPMLEYELIKYAIDKINALSKEIGFSVQYQMTTNALLFNEASIAYMCENISELSLSIDGMEKTNSRNRIDVHGAGHYEKLLKNIKDILKYRNNTRLRMTVTSETVPQLFDNITYLADLGAKNIIPSIDLYDKRWNVQKFSIFEREMKKAAEFLFYHQDKENMTIGMVIDEKTVLKRLGDCDGGENKVILYPDGNLYPCLILTSDKDLIIGDIYGGIDKNKTKEIQCLSKQNVVLCEGCSNYPFCRNVRCKLINKSLTGDYYIPSGTACNMQNVIYHTMKYYQSLNADRI